jgi:hypothetical protein
MPPPEQFSTAIESLHDEACRATGLNDFGESSYREGLQLLLECYDSSARFGDVGRYSAWAMLLNCLRGRLYAIEGLKQNPQALEQPIVKPLFIVGLPRTGTTILHRLLVSHPQNQGLEYWLGSYPQPRPDVSTWAGHERYQEVEKSLGMLDQINPELKKVHEMTAAGADECRLLLMQSFANVTFQSNDTVPRYEQWLYRADMRAAYRLYADTLKLIGLNDPGKRWILKDPSHLWAMDILLETFPDATVIQTHRDPVRLIPSVCSLVLIARRMQEPDITPDAVGGQQLRQWQAVLDMSLAVRRQWPERFIDVFYEDFIGDPVTQVEQIYRALDEELGAENAAAMHSWMAKHSQGKHGSHSYCAEDFGLTDDHIRENFADYCKYFEV